MHPSNESLDRGRTGLTPTQAARKSRQWSREFGNWRAANDCLAWEDWDRLGPERRLTLELIQQAGYDNITREKVGADPATDEEAMESAAKLYGPHPRRRRVR